MLHIRKIEELQKHKKVSQEKLASIIGITRNGLQKKMNSSKSFYVEELQAIADAFNIPITYFLADGDIQETNIDKQIDKVFEAMKEVVKEKIKNT